MHETKKPPYLTQCLRGKGDEIESAFEKSADILFRYFHWVMAVEACTADRQIADHVLEFIDRHVAKRVGSDLLTDLLRGVSLRSAVCSKEHRCRNSTDTGTAES